MQPGMLRTAFFFVVIVLLVGLLAGCGGGGQSESGSQNGDSGGAEQQNSGGGGGGASDQQNEGTKKDRANREIKIALGTIASVTPDENEFTLQPSAEEQGEEPIPFRVRPNTRVTIGGEEAELAALQEGQQATVRYVTVDGTNRARAVQVVGE